MYKTKVKDYGCIQHDKYKFLGASPDGINVDINITTLYGRMVEIKNPNYTRDYRYSKRRLLDSNATSNGNV